LVERKSEEKWDFFPLIRERSDEAFRFSDVVLAADLEGVISAR
jgi:hypothetical protein